jgi:hypothetical protein
MLTWDDLKGRGEIRLDLGSGLFPESGFVGVDNFEGKLIQLLGGGHEAGDFDKVIQDKPIIDWNLQNPIPLPDHSVAEARASHFVEHCSNLDFLFQEVQRLLIPGANFKIIVPYGQSVEGLYPGHPLFLTEKWFQKNPLFQRLFRIETLDFKNSDYFDQLQPHERALLQSIFPRDSMRHLLFNVCKEMTLVACSRKEAANKFGVQSQ